MTTGKRAEVVPNRNGAVTSAVLVHLRVEPAHFDWRWRERPALALLAWEALARDPLARLRRIQVESLERQLILGQRLSPIATSGHILCRTARNLSLRCGLAPAKRERWHLQVCVVAWKQIRRKQDVRTRKLIQR